MKISLYIGGGASGVISSSWLYLLLLHRDDKRQVRVSELDNVGGGCS